MRIASINYIYEVNQNKIFLDMKKTIKLALKFISAKSKNTFKNSNSDTVKATSNTIILLHCIFY